MGVAGLLSLAGCATVLSRREPTTWTQSYGPSGERTDLWNAVPTSDGGGLAVGAESTPAGPRDGVAVKVDGTGELEWSLSAGSAENDWLTGVSETDEGYAVAGSKANQAWFALLDAKGAVDVERSFRERPVTWVYGTTDAPDGGHVLAGLAARGPGIEGSQPLCLKVDPTGRELWRETYDTGRGGRAWFEDVERTDDGYVLAGREASPEGPVGTLAKVGPDGGLEWTRTYGPGRLDRVVPTDDGFLLAGQSGGTGQLLWIDGSGERRWRRRYDTSVEAGLRDVAPLEDGTGHLAVGWKHRADDARAETSAWILETDEDGRRRRERGWEDDGGYSAVNAVTRTDDDGYLLAGARSDRDDPQGEGRIVKRVDPLPEAVEE
jgi:hypothetical protein